MLHIRTKRHIHCLGMWFKKTSLFHHRLKQRHPSPQLLAALSVRGYLLSQYSRSHPSLDLVLLLASFLCLASEVEHRQSPCQLAQKTQLNLSMHLTKTIVPTSDLGQSLPS